jgi:hypothetical protein
MVTEFIALHQLLQDYTTGSQRNLSKKKAPVSSLSATIGNKIGKKREKKKKKRERDRERKPTKLLLNHLVAAMGTRWGTK